MTESRPLRLRRSKRLDVIDRTGGPEAPDLARDFETIRLPDLLRLDLHDATLTVDPTFYCNLACRFCDLPVTSKLAVDWARVSVAVTAMVAVGLRDVHIIGGEPGIYSGTPTLLTALSELGLRPLMFSNGMWAKRRAALDRLIDVGLHGLVVSIKAFDDRTFEMLTGNRRGASIQSAANDNLCAAHHEGSLRYLTFNHVITTPTLESMSEPGWLDALPDLPSLSLTLIEPYRADMRPLVPDPSRLREVLPGVCAGLHERQIPFSVEGVPPCLLGPWGRHSRDVGRLGDTRLRINIKPREEADYLLVYRGYQRLKQFAQVPACRGCSLEDSCPGMHKRLVEWFDDPTIRPLPAEL